MNNLTENIVIMQIEWTNNDSDMHLTCEVRNGFFAYNTIIVLPGSELNKVLSRLQKQHSEVDIQECLKIEQWSEEEYHYTFDFTILTSSKFIFENVLRQEPLKQIRA